jgi:MYXO-CTERM domain-containing protein
MAACMTASVAACCCGSASDDTAADWLLLLLLLLLLLWQLCRTSQTCSGMTWRSAWARGRIRQQLAFSRSLWQTQSNTQCKDGTSSSSSSSSGGAALYAGLFAA